MGTPEYFFNSYLSILPSGIPILGMLELLHLSSVILTFHILVSVLIFAVVKEPLDKNLLGLRFSLV